LNFSESTDTSDHLLVNVKAGNAWDHIITVHGREV